jgi:hypothetical protein
MLLNRSAWRTIGEAKNVDITPGGADDWRRATFCNSGACVEVAVGASHVQVRDSKNESDRGPILSYTRDEWQAFVQGVKAGEFDL